MRKHGNRKGHGIIRLTLVLSLVAIFATVLGTFAYSENTGWAENYISLGIFKVDLIDIFIGNRFALPGDTINKDVSMKNNGTRDAVVRIQLTPSWTPDKDPLDNDRLTDAVTVMFGPDAATDWTYYDGWYYYNKILRPGEETSLLVDALYFSAVSDDTHDTDYSSAAYNLNVLGESLLAMPDAAADVWDMDYELIGGILTWTPR